jgi:hypothetical protein
MRTIIRTAVATLLVAGLSVPAAAQQPPATPISAQVGSGPGAPMQMSGSSPSGRALVWTGAGVFAGGMGVAIYGFLNNKNGVYPEFGEATATSTKLGGAGIAAAFAGGAMMAIGHRISRHAPDVKIGAGSFEVSKRVSW